MQKNNEYYDSEEGLALHTFWDTTSKVFNGTPKEVFPDIGEARQ